MKSIILKSLETNSTTIIPNFGAIMKMGKSTLFNEFLKYDDGKLAQVYATEKGVSLDEAKENINKFIAELNTNIEGGNSHVLEGIGTFSKTGGKLKFVADKVTGAATPTPKKEVTTKEVEKPKVEKVAEKVVEVKAVKPKKVEVKPVTPTPSEKIEEIKAPKTAISAVESTVKAVDENKIKTSVDFLKDEAISKINAFSNKSDLLDFTREDKRKTVIDALNKKLTELNTKAEPVKKEEKKAPVVVAKKVTPPAPVEKKETPEVKSTPVTPAQKTKVEIKKPEVKTEKETPKVEIKKPVVTANPITVKEATDKVEIKKPDIKVTPKVKPAVPEVKTPPVVEKTKEVIKETSKKTEVDEKVIAAISTGLDKTDKETKKRKRRKIVLWLAILCILIGVGIFGFLKQDMVKGWFGMNNEIAATDTSNSDDEDEDDDEDNTDEENEGDDTAGDDNLEDVNDTDNSATDTGADDISVTDVDIETTPEVEPEIEPEVEVEPEPIKEEPVVVVTSATGSYHVVAGSYSSKANAEKKVTKLNKLGYSDAAVLGKFGGLYKVKIASYDTNAAAKAAKSDLKAKDISSTIKKY